MQFQSLSFIFKAMFRENAHRLGYFSVKCVDIFTVKQNGLYHIRLKVELMAVETKVLLEKTGF